MESIQPHPVNLTSGSSIPISRSLLQIGPCRSDLSDFGSICPPLAPRLLPPWFSSPQAFLQVLRMWMTQALQLPLFQPQFLFKSTTMDKPNVLDITNPHTISTHHGIMIVESVSDLDMGTSHPKITTSETSGNCPTLKSAYTLPRPVITCHRLSI